MNGLSKRLVSLTMATAMVFSLTAVPATEAKAATASITSKTTSVQVDKTYTYKIKASKAKTVKVSVSGTAAKAVTVNGKKATSGSNTITLKGGKTLTVKVKVKPTKTVAGKKFTVNYKLDKAKTVKTKSIKVNYSTKGVTLDQTALTMKAGETATLKATMTTEGTNSTIKSWVSSDEKVATVNNGVVTAVAAGTADITVTTSNGKTAKATVTVEDTEKKPEAFTLTADATKADTITATLSREVAADATVTVMKDGIATPVDGKATFNGTKVEFKGTANFTNGTYTITVKEGELSADAKVTVQDEYVKEIVIKSTQALTNAEKIGTVEAGAQAYIYYDVLNQYGESLRASSSINWTTSSGKAKVDKTMGKLTVQNGETNPKPYTYGSLIYVTGVYTKTGVSVSQAVPVGLAQSIDSVKAVGFVNKNDPSKLLTSLPTNFTKDDYRMLYETYDQDGNVIEADNRDLADKGITFISDAPLLIDSTFDKDNTYTIDGKQYSAVKINPGKYVDKGGEVNITAISNKTGTKTVTNFVIGKAAMLQSITISAPNRVVAHGDVNVELPFVAKDTEGNIVTNYETIARSSNALTISCTQGTVVLSEQADGTAKMFWSDDSVRKPEDYDYDYDFTDANGIDIPVSITCVVVGGTSENFMLNVQDTRVPVAIKSVKLNESNEAVIAGADYEGNLLKWNTVYLDQYGDVLDTTWPVCNPIPSQFFDYASKHTYGEGSDAAYYSVRIDTKNSGNINVVNGTNGQYDVPATAWQGGYLKDNSGKDVLDKDGKKVYGFKDNCPVKLSAVSGNAVVSAPVKYSLISTTDAPNAAERQWDVAGKITTQSYSVIPAEKLGGLSFGSIAKQQLTTSQSAKSNANDILEADKNNVIDADKELKIGGNQEEREIILSGVYSGTYVRVPSGLWDVDSDCGFNVEWGRLVSYNQKLAVSDNKIKYSDLYDFNTSKNTRRDTKRTMIVKVYPNNNRSKDPMTVKTDIVLSDAPSSIASVELITDNILSATNTKLDFSSKWQGFWPIHYDSYDPKYGVRTGEYLAREYGVKKYGIDYIIVKDQYGHTLAPETYNVNYKIDNYVENTNEFAHKVNSIVVTGSGSSTAALDMAELGDKFDLTVTVEGKGKVDEDTSVYGSASTKAAFTMGDDRLSYIQSGKAEKETADYSLRQTLGLVSDK